MVICKWCNKEYANLNGLSQHIIVKHKNLGKLYYDMFMLENECDKICICGKEKRYKQGLSGYHKNCGDEKCRNLLMNIAQRKTCKDKYGDETFRNVELNKKTKKERYDDENYNNRTKAKTTFIEIYGVDNPNKTKKVRDKTKSTCLKRYNGNAPACSTTVQDKMKKTCEEKYNDSFYITSDIGRKNRKTKMIELYGTEHALQNENIVKQMKEQNKLKYGYEWPCQQPHYQKRVNKKIKYKDITFDSTLEVELYKFLEENNIKFEYQPEISFKYEYCNEIHFYNPDFKIGDKYYEIKGLHFFKNKDPNNIMICPFHNKNDTLEKINLRNGLYEAKHQCMLRNNVIILVKTEDFEKVISEQELALTYQTKKK